MQAVDNLRLQYHCSHCGVTVTATAVLLLQPPVSLNTRGQSSRYACRHTWQRQQAVMETLVRWGGSYPDQICLKN